MPGLNETEFMELLEQYKDEFYRYAYRNVWNEHAADDVFSSAVMTAWSKRDKFKKGTNFRAWVYRIITNKCFVANREIKRNSIDIDGIDESHFSVDPDMEKRAYEDPDWFLEQCGDELHEALKKLSTAERSCLYLLSVERHSYKEISEIMEMPVGTVMTHLSRGRSKLRRLLIDYAAKEGFIGEDNRHLKKKEEAENKVRPPKQRINTKMKIEAFHEFQPGRAASRESALSGR